MHAAIDKRQVKACGACPQRLGGGAAAAAGLSAASPRPFMLRGCGLSAAIPHAPRSRFVRLVVMVWKCTKGGYGRMKKLKTAGTKVRCPEDRMESGGGRSVGRLLRGRGGTARNAHSEYATSDSSGACTMYGRFHALETNNRNKCSIFSSLEYLRLVR